MLPLSSCIVLWSSRRMVSSERSLESSEATWPWSSRTVSSSLAIVSLFCWLSSRAFCKETWKDKQQSVFSFRVWNSYLTLIKFELFRDVIATFCEAAREKKLYYWYLDAFLFHLKLIDICVEGVAKHRPGACIVYNLRSNVLQISAFKTTEQAPSFSAYKIVCVQAL